MAIVAASPIIRDLNVCRIEYILNPVIEAVEKEQSLLREPPAPPQDEAGATSPQQSPPPSTTLSRIRILPPSPPIQGQAQDAPLEAEPDTRKEYTSPQNHLDPHENPRFSLNAVRQQCLSDWHWMMTRPGPHAYDPLADPNIRSLEGCTIPGYEHIFMTEKRSMTYRRAWGEYVTVWIIEINDECKSYWPVLPTWEQLLLDPNSPVSRCEHLQPLQSRNNNIANLKNTTTPPSWTIASQAQSSTELHAANRPITCHL
ncbi:hypothetical protein QBC35DRAFT_226259 [Podospora australis]|uniref:Uncharacterized protein n=1 Tax=Podospora australis TaxID=1536484 RepID=A0AAN7AP61_9PEZI|nr:hypothetical protein QBC35DRAFT_226259 [Podospora australis]